ncbi:SDR family NAD(P)-dependent oxidoreductase [Chelativorans sp.]|uniref:SDR family NAD(P)-dependent oxidoreductase n=1 Tax=Chelativorans sp. TaxID=2203393 RepID=UPI0035C77046
MTAEARKRALVTGAAMGIGRAVAEKLASQGAALVRLDRAKEQLAEVEDSLRSAGADARSLVGSTADAGVCAKAVGIAESASAASTCSPTMQASSVMERSRRPARRFGTRL